jgi:POT family proton-dependent oligopeptide transporter
MSTAITNKKHPRGLYVLFMTEMWERFGYYLMVGIFFLYMVDPFSNGGLGFSKGKALDIVGTYVALVYLAPFLGGLIADRLLGYRKSILLGGAMMSAGYFGLSVHSESAMYISCLSIILGNGFFKPNISTLLGNMYNEEALKAKKDSAYNIFYMGINIGAFICNFVAAYMRNNYGWGYAFAAAGFGLVIALVWFAYGMKHVKHADIIKPTQPGDMSLGKILLYVFVPALVFGGIGWMIPGNLMGSDANDAFIFACLPITVFFGSLFFRASKEDKRGIGALLAFFVVAIIFWIVYNQNATSLTIWAETYMDRSMPPAVEKFVQPLNLVQKVDVTPDTFPAIDHFFREQADAKGNAMTAVAVNPYYQNVPRDQWPAPGVEQKLVSTEILQSVNPIFIVIFTPLVLAVFGWFLKRGRPISTPIKLVWAMIFTGLSALIMVVPWYLNDIYMTKSAAIWLVMSYAIFTIGELLISPIGLSMVSKLAPQRITALMMGGWFLSTSLGGKFSGMLASTWDTFENKATYFYILTALCVVAAIGMYIMARWLKAIIAERTGSI